MSNVREPDEDPAGRFPWFLLTGLIFGALIGLLFAWFLAPVQYTDASPSHLPADDKDKYRAMIALAFESDKDRGRAEARLNLLGDNDPVQALDSEAQRYLGGSGPANEAQAMATLVVSLRQTPASALPRQSPTSPALANAATATPTALAPKPQRTATAALTAGLSLPTATRFPTLHSLSTLTPSPTPGAPFTLVGQSPICNPELVLGLLQIQVEDAATRPVAGVRVSINWKDGEDFFFTGLAHEISPGYADFVMTSGTEYTLQVGESGEPVRTIVAPECSLADGAKYLGGVKLRFRQ